MLEYHGQVVRLEWQSKQALTASSRVCGESQRGSAVVGGFVCEWPYGTPCASTKRAAPEQNPAETSPHPGPVISGWGRRCREGPTGAASPRILLGCLL